MPGGRLMLAEGGGARRWLDELTGGAAIFPLAVLFLLYFFDQFDTAAFGVLAPDIEKAFHLSDARFGFIVILNVTIVLLLAVPVGHLGDRLSRRRMVVAAGLVAGVFSLLTGVVGTAALLLLVRIGNGVGQLANGTLHNSLLADYYPPSRRAGIFSVHQRAVQLAAIFGTGLTGAVAALAGWRVAFMILIVPATIAALAALRLREPVRGGEDPGPAGTAAAPLAFRRAARSLWRIPTLRRQYMAWLFVGAGVVPLVYLLPLYLQRAYGVGDFYRGLIGAVNAAFTLGGVAVSAGLTRRWSRQDPGRPLLGAGAVLALAGVGLVAIAAAPDLPLALVAAAATSFVAGVFYVPFYTVQSAVSPAPVRSLSFGFGAGFLIAGTWLLFLIPGVASVSTDHGIRWGIGVLAPYFIIGGAVLASAHRFVAGDSARALKLLNAPSAGPAPEDAAAACLGVSASYGKIPVLFDVEMAIPEGEIVGLLGTNGAGKSTILKVLSGLLPVDEGRVFFAGRDITEMSPVERVESGLVMVPGGRGVFPSLTVGENLRLAGWMSRKDPRALEAARRKAFELFPVLEARLGTRAGELSGGEQQMLCMAQALYCRPKLLLIDELSLGLAPSVVSTLVDAVRKINDEGTTVVVVEQSVNLAATIAERVHFMEKGQVRFSGRSKELAGRDDLIRSIFLGTRERHRPVPASGSREVQAAPSLLSVRGLTRSFGGVKAVNDVGLTAPAGQITGIIGSNGAGKTTLFDLCSGYVRPDAGSVELMGVDVTPWSAARRAKLGMGRTFQDARLFPSMTVAETIATALERHVDVKDPLACLARVRAVTDSERRVAARADQLIGEMGLGRYREAFISELSTGTRRVVELACAVAHDPAVLLLDEPSSGIAQAETEALGRLLLDLRDRHGMTLVVIEHDIPLVSSISDRLVCMHLGEVLAEGEPAEVLQLPEVVASYLGTDPATIARSGRASVGGRTRRLAPAARPDKPPAPAKKAAARSGTPAPAKKAAAKKVAAKKAPVKKAAAKKAAARSGTPARTRRQPVA